ncbi:hypothetical protein ACIQ2D_21710 [Lysinibacillus sp. NPDC097287]|uniref:hypothetical protein n=1 Tax=Lysinibacillus sp. NPDC097287 TaxID=3364144 RepID=UPI00382AFF1E
MKDKYFWSERLSTVLDNGGNLTISAFIFGQCIQMGKGREGIVVHVFLIKIVV